MGCGESGNAQPSTFDAFDKRVRNAIEDPLKKAQFEENKRRFMGGQDKIVRMNDDWREDVMRFLSRFDNGQSALTFQQLKQATPGSF